MGWKRARTPEQKEQRTQALLDAAAALFERQGYLDVSLKAIAKEAGICKANAYRYFESKEAIFLQLLLQDEVAWLGTLERALAPLAGSNDGEAVAREIAMSLAERPRLAALLAVLTTVLERNLTVEALVAFKSEMLGHGLRLINTLHAAMPALSVQRCRSFVLHAHHLIAGIWPAAHPSPELREATAQLDYGDFETDFGQELQSVLALLLRGMLDEARSERDAAA